MHEKRNILNIRVGVKSEKSKTMSVSSTKKFSQKRKRRGTYGLKEVKKPSPSAMCRTYLDLISN